MERSIVSSALEGDARYFKGRLATIQTPVVSGWGCQVERRTVWGVLVYPVAPGSRTPGMRECR
jgi:hypothetical protein